MQEYKNRTPSGVYKAPAVRQRKKRNTLNLYLTVGVAVIAALGALLSVNVFFNLNAANIQVNGVSLYTAEQIQYVGGIADGQNLVRLNTDFIAGRLKKNLVYVDDVKVEKKYPDKLIVTVTEAQEAAEIETDSGYSIISESGRVLKTSSERTAGNLPLVVGYELKDNAPGVEAQSEDSQKTGILTELFKQMNAVSMDKIVKIDLTDRTDIRLLYDNRIEICLGSSVDMDIKLSQLMRVLDSRLPESYEGTLRYNGIDSGISAIPKQADVPTKPIDSSSNADNSSSLAQDVYGDNGLTDSYGDDYMTDSAADNGYADYGYDDNYDQGYNDDWNYDGNYDQNYADNWNYNDNYNYNDGYSDGYYDDYTGYTEDWGGGYGY